jgi:hypothetical protein
MTPKQIKLQKKCQDSGLQDAQDDDTFHVSTLRSFGEPVYT